MNYLFIGAHPDDIEYSCGGTLLRLAREGNEVYTVVMTGGGASTSGSVEGRKEEQKAAFNFSKAKRLFMLDYKDGAIEANASSIKEICGIMDMIKPDVVITHYPQDSHQDHRAVSAIVKSATRRRCSLIYFDSYSSVNFNPTLYVDISEFATGKVELLKCFRSQLIKYSERNIDFAGKALLINEVNGYESKCKFAEGYVVDNYII